MTIVSFRGRIGRSAFFGLFLLLYVLAVAFAIAATAGGVGLALEIPAKDVPAELRDFKMPASVSWAFLVVGLFGFLASFLGFVGLSVRRLHDFGLTGFFVLLYPVLKYVVPDFGWDALASPADLLWLIIMVAQPGTKGPNVFGPDPRAMPAHDDIPPDADAPVA